MGCSEPRAERRRHDTPSEWRGALTVALTLLLLGLSRIATADELRPFQASYLWHWEGLGAVAESRLELVHRQDDVWVYSSSSSPRGIGVLYPMRPKLTSTMRISAQGVRPLSFHSSGGGSRHDADVTFDWDSGRAHGLYEGAKLDLTVTAGVQDDLSVQIAMMTQLLQGMPPDQLHEIDKHGVRDYAFRHEGEETLTTPIGRIPTEIYSSHAAGSPRVTRYWCAPSRGYIPLKVQQTLHDQRTLRDEVQWTLTLEALRRE